MPEPARTAASTFNRVAIDLTHEAFEEMAAALRTRITPILHRWRGLSVKAVPDLRELTLVEFENAIGEILNLAADALQSADPMQLRGVVEKAPVHGVDRFVQEHSVLDLFEEVRILRGVIILELAEEMGRPLFAREAATFHAIFDIIIQQGVMALVNSQGRALQEAHATTRDMNDRLIVSAAHQHELTEIAEKSEARLRESEAELARAADQLSKMNRAKDEFLAMLSHELRNPIAPIRAAVHLMKSQERGSENLLQRQAREIIERQVGNLTKIVSDLLEVSRVVSGRIHLSPQVMDVNQIVRHAVETSQTNFEQRKHTLSLHLCDDGAWVNADATRLEEVFVNLLNNAAKYTPDGGRIEVHCEQPPGAGVARVRIRDNGVGIDKDLLEGGRLFDLFTQADRSLARSAGGLGIGLSLAHRLVHLHGGTIEVKSPPDGADKGSEFIVGLPLAPAPPEAETSEPTAEESGKPEGIRVLLVDDNIDLVMMLASSLRQKGYSVQVAYTGPDGLRTAQQWRPDVVLLDIGLPGMDGYEVAKRLRSDPGFGGAGATMRLVAVTGYGRDADLALAQEAGFDAHLTKPVEFKELETVIAATTSRET